MSNDFENYLIKNGYVSKSIQRATTVAKRYNEWLQAQNLNAQTATYNDLMNYIGSLQKDGSSKAKINEYLRNIRLYYDYLEIPNIAFGVVINGEEKNIMPLFNYEELENIYNHFESRSKKAIKSCAHASSKKAVGAPLPPLCQYVLRHATAYKIRYNAIRQTLQSPR